MTFIFLPSLKVKIASMADKEQVALRLVHELNQKAIDLRRPLHTFGLIRSIPEPGEDANYVIIERLGSVSEISHRIRFIQTNGNITATIAPETRYVWIYHNWGGEEERGVEYTEGV